MRIIRKINRFVCRQKQRLVIREVVFFVVFVIAVSSGVMAQSVPTIFPLKVKAGTDTHTGDVFLSVMKNDSNNMITNFLFEKESRGRWHQHPNAVQTMIVLSGEGYYQEEGKPKVLIKKGDIIITPRNVRHWNGATPWTHCECITVTDNVAGEQHVVQQGYVTDNEFNSPVEP